ncbi:MAG: GAF and ANTAR domain-containing protein [Frankiaceae bacterium]|nr:GAF and ANTAR domain-containing protein [Frankiaceae bacterium]
MASVADDLASVLEAIAQSLQEAPSPAETLEVLTNAAVYLIEGTDYAAVTMIQGRKALETVAATDVLVRTIDQAQYDAQQGPCLDALYEVDVVRMNDMEAEERWPEFTARARGHGVCSMMCFRLFQRGSDAAALNTYARERDAFTDNDELTGRLLATHAAVALAAARNVDHLEHAVDSRDVIGQAKGILMERHNLTGDAAFRLLVQASQTTHIKLIEVARRVAQRE